MAAASTPWPGTGRSRRPCRGDGRHWLILRNRAVAQGLVVLQVTTGDTERGPASFVLEDPDGSPVLIDQHV